MSVWGKVRKVLGKLTDLLLWGRQRGLWTEKQGRHEMNDRPPELPHEPGSRSGRTP